MGKSRRVFTRDFKVAAVKELESGKTLGYVARRLEVNPNTLHRWRRELRTQPTKAFSGHTASVCWLTAAKPSWSARSARWQWRSTS